MVQIRIPHTSSRSFYNSDTCTEPFTHKPHSFAPPLHTSPKTNSSQVSSEKVQQMADEALSIIREKQPESSKSSSSVPSLQKTDVASSPIIDKIKSVWKAIDSTLDPVTKTGFTLSILLLLGGCIPGIGQILLSIGLITLFITFLLWLGKFVEDQASTPAQSAEDKIQTLKSTNL